MHSDVAPFSSDLYLIWPLWKTFFLISFFNFQFNSTPIFVKFIFWQTSLWFFNISYKWFTNVAPLSFEAWCVISKGFSFFNTRTIMIRNFCRFVGTMFSQWIQLALPSPSIPALSVLVIGIEGFNALESFVNVEISTQNVFITVLTFFSVRM